VLAVVIASLLAMVCAVLVHYEVLRALSFLTPRLAIPPRQRIVVVVIAAILAHLAEIAVYAGTFWMIPLVTDADDLGLDLPLSFLRCVYYSLESYASLGSVDFPDGLLRIPAGVEALNGLILIGWTASYTYLVMREFWADDLVERAPLPEYYGPSLSPLRKRVMVDDDLL
jgi:hypothetical protein